MAKPLTTAAFKKAGVKFGTFRYETAAGYIERSGFSITAKGENGAILNWLMMHRDQWPTEWDDATVAERLPTILSQFAPQAEVERATALATKDKARYQDVLRAAQTALFA